MWYIIFVVDVEYIVVVVVVGWAVTTVLRHTVAAAVLRIIVIVVIDAACMACVLNDPHCTWAARVYGGDEATTPHYRRRRLLEYNYFNKYIPTTTTRIIYNSTNWRLGAHSWRVEIIYYFNDDNCSSKCLLPSPTPSVQTDTACGHLLMR